MKSKNRKPKGYANFYCRKHAFYGPCEKCMLLNGACDYQQVFDRESAASFNPCPICSRKGTEKCKECRKP